MVIQHVSIESFHKYSAGLESLNQSFGERVVINEPLRRYTSARVGGPADVLLEVQSAEEMEIAVSLLWESDAPFVILGGGSNMLVSDAGVRGVVLLNHARRIKFDKQTDPPTVWAESGANFGALARQSASRGLSGLEWAAGIPGTLGGAIMGNAGAHGQDMSSNLLMAVILHRDSGKETWNAERLGFKYRSSVLKRSSLTAGSQARSDVLRSVEAVVLSALLRLECSTHAAVQAKMDEFTAYRHRTQPPGASMGSMFKNPPGDYAGRLIEAVGLKGTRLGEAQISTLHANFFINLGQASASDILALIRLAHRAVEEKFGVKLELEIELVGEWLF